MKNTRRIKFKVDDFFFSYTFWSEGDQIFVDDGARYRRFEIYDRGLIPFSVEPHHFNARVNSTAYTFSSRSLFSKKLRMLHV